MFSHLIVCRDGVKVPQNYVRIDFFLLFVLPLGFGEAQLFVHIVVNSIHSIMSRTGDIIYWIAHVHEHCSLNSTKCWRCISWIKRVHRCWSVIFLVFGRKIAWHNWFRGEFCMGTRLIDAFKCWIKWPFVAKAKIVQCKFWHFKVSITFQPRKK